MKKTVKKGMVVTLSACMLANSVPLSNFTVQAALKQEFVEFTNERIIPASGLAVVGTLLGKSGFIKKLNRMDITSNRSQHQIKNGDIVLTYL